MTPQNINEVRTALVKCADIVFMYAYGFTPLFMLFPYFMHFDFL